MKVYAIQRFDFSRGLNVVLPQKGTEAYIKTVPGAGVVDGSEEEVADELVDATGLYTPPQAEGEQPAVGMTLTEAVASLDDANDDHWTKGGAPSIDVLKHLTGADVTRAEVDALDPPRVRAKQAA